MEASATEVRRSDLVGRALRLEGLTAAWVTVEAGVAIGSGIAAHSVTLVAFGADSVIELMSAAVLLSRLIVELRRGEAFSPRAEQTASRLASGLLLLLAAYVLAAAAWSLWRGEGQEFSPVGLALAVLAIPIMAGLAKAKLRLADRIASRALRADAAESIACGYLSAIVVVGLVAQLFLDAWWIDGASALALLPFLWREAREAWRGEECCD